MNEFDGLTNEQILTEIGHLRHSLWQIEEDAEDRGRSIGDDYMSSDMQERLEVLIKECERRGVVVPDEVQSLPDD